MSSLADLANGQITARSYELVVACSFSYDDFSSGVGLQFATLPVGAIVTGGAVYISTAWNSGTSDAIEVGDAVDPDEYLTSTSIAATGATAFNAITNLPVTTSNDDLLIEITSAGAAATAGVGQIYVTYVDPTKADENYE